MWFVDVLPTIPTPSELDKLISALFKARLDDLRERNLPLSTEKAPNLANYDLDLWHREEALHEGCDNVFTPKDESREGGGFLATYAASGAGKSRYIDALIEELQKQASEKDILVVPLPITFNAGMEFDTTHDFQKRNPTELLVTTAICKRILFSYVFGQEGYREMGQILRAYHFNSITAVLKAILRHLRSTRQSKRPIFFLAVDELLKTGRRASELIMSQLCKDAIDGSHYKDVGYTCKVLVTTLDSRVLMDKEQMDYATASHRPIDWVVLPPIPTGPFGDMCKREYKSFEPSVKHLVSLTRGHPRSLYCVNKALKKFGARELYANLLKYAQKLIGQFTTGSRKDMENLLARSVLNLKTLHHGAPLLNSAEVVDYKRQAFVPSLSPLLLDGVKWKNSILKSTMGILLRLDVTDSGLELFYLHFVRLRRFCYHAVYKKSRPIRIREWYDGAQLLAGNSSLFDLEVTVPSAKARPTSFSSGEKTELAHTLAIPDKPNNPGFDVVEVFRSAHGKRQKIVVFVEHKFSQAKSTTKLSARDIHNKLEQMHLKHFTADGILKRFGVREENTIWLVAACRNWTSTMKVTDLHGYKGCVLGFDRKALLHWFGPTFCDVAEFQLSRIDLYAHAPK